MKRLENRADTILPLSDPERAALLWAVEVAHGVPSGPLLGDPDVAVLLADPPVDEALLDELADRLFVAGQLISET